MDEDHADSEETDIEVSSDYIANVTTIAKADTDVQAATQQRIQHHQSNAQHQDDS